MRSKPFPIPLPSSASAFTLVELVVALAVLATLFALAVPSYARYLDEQRLLDQARRLSDGIMLARSEAVKRNGYVVICATTPGDGCGDARHWHEGWIVFEDTDGNAEQDPGDALMGIDPAAAAGVTIVGNRPVERYLRFDYMGQARLASGALQMGTIEVCKAGLHGYRVVLANSGRTRIDRMTRPCP